MVAEGKLSDPSNSFYLERTIAHVFIGIFMLVIFSKTPYSIFERYIRILFFWMVVVMIGVLQFGETYNGAKGWIDIPWLPSIQPVEFMKLALIMMLAFFMKKHKSLLGNLQQGFIPYFFYVATVLVLLALQPDFWSVLIIVPIAILMYFIGWGNKRFIIISLVLASIWGVAVYLLGHTEFWKETLKIRYISVRIDSFFRSNKEITESKTNDKKDYQLKHGFIALWSGGFSGLWFGKSIQKFWYLPEVQWDFIFSVIVEELGFIGAFFLLSVYLTILYRGLYIARSVKDLFGKYLAFGITAWIFIQAFINMGVNLNIIPLTGVTLPFVSYGGTSLIALTVAVGILLSISRHAEYKPQNLSDALQARRRIVL